MMKIGFIGVGAMAKAIIKGLLNTDLVAAENILVHSAHAQNYENFAKQYQLTAMASNQQLVNQADFIILAVTPDKVKEVLGEVADHLEPQTKTLISIVGGLNLSRLEELAGYNLPILRALPNINVEINAGMTALAANEQLTGDKQKQAAAIFEKIGAVDWLDQKDFGIFSALAGSSPAYVDFFIDALSRAGVKYGLSKDQATRIAAQATQGSAKMVLASDKTPFELVDQVSSPGGSTIAGLLAMEEHGLMTAVVKGIDATVKKDRGEN